MWMQFWLLTVVPKYLNCATFSKDLSAWFKYMKHGLRITILLDSHKSSCCHRTGAWGMTWNGKLFHIITRHAETNGFCNHSDGFKSKASKVGNTFQSSTYLNVVSSFNRKAKRVNLILKPRWLITVLKGIDTSSTEYSSIPYTNNIQQAIKYEGVWEQGAAENIWT